MVNEDKEKKKKARQLKAREEVLEKHPQLVQINHPARILIVGKSQSGKTTLAVDVIKALIPQVDEVWMCSPTYKFQPTFDPIRDDVKLFHSNLNVVLRTLKANLRDGIANEKHVTGKKMETKRLLILDDVSYEQALNTGNKGFLNSLFYNAVWWNISVVVICHKVANVGGGIRENLEHLILFQTVVNKEQEAIYDNWGGVFTQNKKAFLEFFKVMISDKVKENAEERPFIYVNLQKGGQIYYKFNERITINS